MSVAPKSIRAAGDSGFKFFRVVQGYLHEASELVELPEYLATILSQPKNELIVNFPVRMDDGHYKNFKGYRIQHNNLMGPYKGGLRFHHSVSLDDLKALATMMTWKSPRRKWISTFASGKLRRLRACRLLTKECVPKSEKSSSVKRRS